MNRLTNTLKDPGLAVAAVIADRVGTSARDEVLERADVIEIRADMLASGGEAFLGNQILRFAVLPLIFSDRVAEDSGELSNYTLYLPLVDAVDVGMHSAIYPQVQKAAHEQGKEVIASTHNYDTTPPTKQLEQMLSEGLEKGANRVKLATRVRTDEEREYADEFAAAHSNDGTIFVRMDDDPQSKTQGTGIIYASVGGVTVAPGQLDLSQTCDMLQDQGRRLHPVG